MRPDMPRRQIFNGTLGALFGFCLLILLVALQSSCSTAATRPSSESFRVEIIDNLDERRFDVSVTSLDDHAICVSKENWPDESGGFAGPQDYTHLRVGSGTLPVSSAFSSIYSRGAAVSIVLRPMECYVDSLPMADLQMPTQLQRSPGRNCTSP